MTKFLLPKSPLVKFAKRALYHSSSYTHLRRPGEKICFDRSVEEFCRGEAKLCDRLDDLIDRGHCYKSDATSTVAGITLPQGNSIINGDWVIKRYNHKGASTTLKMVARHSRAERSFLRGLILEQLHIDSPQPLIFAVRFRWGLPYNSYIVTRQSAGETLRHLAEKGKISREQWPGIVSGIRAILHTLHSHHITHGDIKPTNILISENRLEIIDLDSMRIHRLGRTLDHFCRKDLGALERRIAAYAAD